jgi:hypothetical protein
LSRTFEVKDVVGIDARFHLQEVELHYTTGRHMRHPFLVRWS